MLLEWSIQNKYDNFIIDENEIFIKDDLEYEITININLDANEIIDYIPILFIGDNPIKLKELDRNDYFISFTTRIKNDFFSNAHFHNYFGESQLTLEVSVNKNMTIYNKIVNVVLKKDKADIANNMLEFLSSNLGDITKICFSKTKSGFSQTRGITHQLVKFENLTNSITYLEDNIDKFFNKNKFIEKKDIDLQNIHPKIYDHNTFNWLLDNLDKMIPSEKNKSDIFLNNNYYNITLPNTHIQNDTNDIENHVIHTFIFEAIKYCNDQLILLSKKSSYSFSEFENSSYIRFDQVIKKSISSILNSKINILDEYLLRLYNLKNLFNSIIPVVNLKHSYPIISSFTLKNSHYLNAFQLFENFYHANDVDNSINTSILLGLRNLSQIYEFCCMYKILSAMNQLTSNKNTLRSSRQIAYDKSWQGKNTMKINVLANEFTYIINEKIKVTICYEKPFYTLDYKSPQKNTLFRTSISTKPYIPDFTFKVENLNSGTFEYSILDAKFMNFKNVKNKYKEMYQKYGCELKAFGENDISHNSIKYVGLLFGIHDDNNFIEDSFISKSHSPNSDFPIIPYFSAFSLCMKNNGSINYILKNYIIRDILV